jgi:hypothetical protein
VGSRDLDVDVELDERRDQRPAGQPERVSGVSYRIILYSYICIITLYYLQNGHEGDGKAGFHSRLGKIEGVGNPRIKRERTEH